MQEIQAIGELHADQKCSAFMWTKPPETRRGSSQSGPKPLGKVLSGADGKVVTLVDS